MARLPVAGRVKTRLARQVGATEAVRLFRALLGDTMRRLGRDRRWRLVVAVTPAAARHAPLWRRLAPGARVIAQADGGLGLRMARLLARAGPAAVAVVGSDIVDLRACHVAASLAALRGADVVLGPAEDGGFWLVGARAGVPAFRRGEGALRGIAWSRGDTAAATRRSLMRAGLRVAEGPPRADLDELPARRG